MTLATNTQNPWLFLTGFTYSRSLECEMHINLPQLVPHNFLPTLFFLCPLFFSNTKPINIPRSSHCLWFQVCIEHLSAMGSCVFPNKTLQPIIEFSQQSRQRKTRKNGSGVLPIFPSTNPIAKNLIHSLVKSLRFPLTNGNQRSLACSRCNREVLGHPPEQWGEGSLQFFEKMWELRKLPSTLLSHSYGKLPCPIFIPEQIESAFMTPQVHNVLYI